MKNRIFLVTILLTAALFSCTNPFLPSLGESDESSNPQTASDTAGLTIHLGGQTVRSILPTGFDAATYDITLTYSDAGAGIADVTRTDIDASSSSISFVDLPLGDWNITVKGYSASAVQVAEASDMVTLTAGVNNVTLTMGPVTTAAGSLQVDYQWDTSAADSAAVTLTAFNSANPPTFAGADQTALLSDDGVLDTVTIDAGAGTASVDVRLPAGDYILTLQLSLGGNNQPPINRHVRIYGNLTSSATVDLTQTTLSRMPENPTGIAAETLDPGTLRISWESDDPLTEYYVLIRDIHDEASPHRDQWIIPAGTTHYDDITFNHSVIHSYGVIAVNSMGQTTPVAGESMGSGTVVLLGIESHEWGGLGKDVVTDPDVAKVEALAYINGSGHGNDPSNAVGYQELYVQEPREDWSFLPDDGIWFGWITAYVPPGTAALDFDIVAKDAENNPIYLGSREGVAIPTPDVEFVRVFSTETPPEKVDIAGLPHAYYPVDEMAESLSLTFTSPNPYTAGYGYVIQQWTGSAWADTVVSGTGAFTADPVVIDTSSLQDDTEKGYRLRLTFSDAFGNTTSEGAFDYSWEIVDAPVVMIGDTPSADLTKEASHTFALSTESGATHYKFRVKVGPADWSAWSAPADFASQGSLTLDLVGDYGFTPADTASVSLEVQSHSGTYGSGEVWFPEYAESYSWTVDQTSPTLSLSLPLSAAELAGRAYEAWGAGIRFEGSGSDDVSFAALEVRHSTDGGNSYEPWQVLRDEPGSFAHTYSLDDGTYHVEVRTADAAGNYSEVLSYGDVTVYSMNPGISIGQTSSVGPQEIQARGGQAGVYNWDQDISLVLSNGDWPGTKEISIDGGTTWQDYASPLAMGDGDAWDVQVRACFGGTAGSSVVRTVSDSYEIDYDAYPLVTSVTGSTGMTDRGSSRYTSPGSDISISVSYTPVCGETFSIYRYQERLEMDEEDLPGAYDSWSDWPLAAHYNRLDTLTAGTGTSELTAGGGQTTGYSDTFTVHLDSGSGRVDTAPDPDVIKGALTERNKFFLEISGRSYASDPAAATEANPDINPLLGNLSRIDSYIVFPKLSITALEMYDRPKITPYLWTKQEPIVTVQVKQTDYFTGTTTSAEADTGLYFRMQYGVKDFPYAQTTNTISWQTNTAAAEFASGGNTVEAWKDPDLLESTLHITAVEQPLTIVDIDPFGYAGRNGGTQTLVPPAGWAYYQIDNPYDTAGIGESAHYSEINDGTHSGELDDKAFRTVVRFRTRAWKAGFRSSAVVKSFESDTTADFDTSSSVTVNGVSVRRLDAGTAAQTSDFTDGYQSYPIEVYEHYEGWGADNNLYENWYQKHGITWYGNGRTGAQNNRSESRNRYFDASKKKIVIYSHGWQKTGYYEIPVYTGWNRDGDNTTDWTSWNNAHNGEEWFAEYWRNLGYNVGFFHWNKMAQGQHSVASVGMPGSAEKKIWYPHQEGLGGAGLMTMHSESIGENASIADAMADATRSASVGLMLAQEILDALPSGYNSVDEFIIVGHSLGNNVVTNATEKLIAAYKEIPPRMTDISRIPTRVDLLDPYWGNNDDDIYTYVSGETVRNYSDIFHGFTRGGIGIPVQWYKTSALTQTTVGYNDSNEDFFKKTNYTKLYFGTCDSGYIKTGNMTPRLSGELHGEAVSWFFRSIQRSQDDVATIFTTVDGDKEKGNKSRGGAAFVSARSRTSALYSRLNSFRGSESNFRWFELDKWNNGANRSMSVEDDWFFQRGTYWTSPWMGSKDYHMNM